MNFFVFCLVLFFIHSPNSRGANPSTRSEWRRYTLLRDKSQILRDVKREKRSSYLDFELTLSSGVKGFFSDLSDASKQSNATTETLSVLAKEANTERFLDLDLNLALPLPFLSVSESAFLPVIFFENNLSSSFSIASTGTSVTVTDVSLYLKFDQKIGVSANTKWKGKNYGKFALYQLTRKDLDTSVSATSLASNNGDLIDTDDLSKSEKFIASDYSYELRDNKRSLILSLEELLLIRESSSEKVSTYTKNPLLNLKFMQFDKSESSMFKVTPYGGFHTRFSYALHDGIYLGIMAKGVEIPFMAIGQVDFEFLNLIFGVDSNHFRLNYGIKLPYRNPRNDLWVSALHSLAFNFPF